MTLELKNLAEGLGKGRLAKIGEELRSDVDSDDLSRTEWMSMHAHWLRLYYQTDVPKSRPWEHSSEESIPLLAEGCNQFHARAYPAFFPNANIVKCVPTGKVGREDRERADRVGRHMAWQLMVRDKTYRRNKDALLLSVPLHGSVFTKTYYDPTRKIPLRVRNVRASDLIIPYGTGPRELEDVGRKTEIMWLSVNETRIRKASGYFIDEGEPWTGEKNEVDQEADKVQGVTEGDKEASDGLCKIGESHCLLDLDGDGIREPYIVTYDFQSEKVLRVAIRYEVDEGGAPKNDKIPVEHFTHYPFLPNPDGFYGLGYGHLIGKINTAVNKMVRQTIDAGTLSNDRGGFVDTRVTIAGGELEWQLGQYKKVNFGGDDLRKSIFEFQNKEPSQVIQAVMTLLMERADRLTTVTEALTGQTDKVMQPTTILALIEQGLQTYSTTFERLWDSWQMELAKIYRLNALYMDPEEYFTVNDLEGPQQLKVFQSDYADDLEVMPVADPKMATQQQKLAKAEAQWMFLSQNPLVMSSPPHFYEASRRYAETLEIDDIETVIPNPTPPQPLRIDDQHAENMGALMNVPQMSPVFPDQNHLEHIKVIDEMMADPIWSRNLSEAGVAALLDHKQQHLAYTYGLTESTLVGESMSDGSGQLAPVEDEPGNDMAFRQTPGAVPAEMGAGGQPGAPGAPQGPAGGAGVPEQPGAMT